MVRVFSIRIQIFSHELSLLKISGLTITENRREICFQEKFREMLKICLHNDIQNKILQMSGIYKIHCKKMVIDFD